MERLIVRFIVCATCRSYKWKAQSMQNNRRSREKTNAPKCVRLPRMCLTDVKLVLESLKDPKFAITLPHVEASSTLVNNGPEAQRHVPLANC